MSWDTKTPYAGEAGIMYKQKNTFLYNWLNLPFSYFSYNYETSISFHIIALIWLILVPGTNDNSCTRAEAELRVRAEAGLANETDIESRQSWKSELGDKMR